MGNKKHRKKGSNKVDYAMKRKTSVSKIVEFFRAVLVFALLGLFLVFFGRSVERYQKGRIATDQRDVDQRFFNFPSIAICAAQMEPVVVGESLPIVLHTEHNLRMNKTHSEDASVYWGSTPRPEFGLNTTDGKLWQFYTFLDGNGKHVFCNRYNPSPHMETRFGLGHRLTFFLQTKTIHWSERVMSLTFNDGGTMSWLGAGFFGNTIVLVPAYVAKEEDKFFKAVQATITFGEKISLSSKENPCYTDAEADTVIEFGHCIDNFLTKETGCARYDLECWSKRDEEDLDPTVIYDQILAELRLTSEKEIIRRTGCRPPCRVKTYDFQLDSTFDHFREPGMEKFDMILSLYNPKGVLSVKEEYVVYDGYALFADMGGLVGVLLGMSCIAVFDYAVEAAGTILGLMGRGGERRGKKRQR